MSTPSQKTEDTGTSSPTNQPEQKPAENTTPSSATTKKRTRIVDTTDQNHGKGISIVGAGPRIMAELKPPNN